MVDELCCFANKIVVNSEEVKPVCIPFRAAQPRGGERREKGFGVEAGESETHRTAGGTAAGLGPWPLRPVSRRLTARRAAQPRGWVRGR